MMRLIYSYYGYGCEIRPVGKAANPNKRHDIDLLVADAIADKFAPEPPPITDYSATEQLEDYMRWDNRRRSVATHILQNMEIEIL